MNGQPEIVKAGGNVEPATLAGVETNQRRITEAAVNYLEKTLAFRDEDTKLKTEAILKRLKTDSSHIPNLVRAAVQEMYAKFADGSRNGRDLDGLNNTIQDLFTSPDLNISTISALLGITRSFEASTRTSTGPNIERG